MLIEWEFVSSNVGIVCNEALDFDDAVQCAVVACGVFLLCQENTDESKMIFGSAHKFKFRYTPLELRTNV